VRVAARASLAAVSLCVGFGLAGAGAAGCRRVEMASPAQCERLLDRFIDLKMSEDAHAASMTSEERAALRGRIAGDVASDSDVQQVRNQCQTEVRETEFQCAIAAPTSKAWNDCIE
jgi:hypothetical protein